MQRGIGRRIVSIGPVILAAGLAAGAGSLAGCLAADGSDGGIIVLKNVAADASCKITTSESETGISHGSLDLNFVSGYLFIAQMKSRITALEGQEDQRIIFVKGAKIDIEFPGTTLFSADELAQFKAMALTHYESPFSAMIAPNGGLADAGFTLIRAELTQKVADKVGKGNPLRLEVIATFTIDGDMSGATVTSQQFSFPITMGYGVVFKNAGSCPLPSSFGMPRTGYACNAAQDGIVDCCTALDGLVCPATVSM
jgi:hypothetical protein